MVRRIVRLASIAAGAAMLLALAGTVAAASPAKLTAVAVEDSTAAPAAGQAWIRVLHASPDAPAVDVYVDGTKAITGLAFGQIAPAAAPGYVPVPAGAHAIKVCATGSTTVCPIDVPALTVADGKKYTIAATDALSRIAAQVIEDAPAAGVGGKAQLRVVHFSADTPAVDVYVNGTSRIVTGLAYPKATGYLQVDGATYSVKVCASGSTTVCPIDVAALAVANGKAYSVFAVGSLAAATATAAPAATPPTTATVAATTATASGGLAGLAALALVALVTLVSLAFTLPFATRRARR
ncbi:MAG TPA: DUF4397 domain-containing protein [Candidatus Limnocylindrales bacterium]